MDKQNYMELPIGEKIKEGDEAMLLGELQKWGPCDAFAGSIFTKEDYKDGIRIRRPIVTK